MAKGLKIISQRGVMMTAASFIFFGFSIIVILLINLSENLVILHKTQGLADRLAQAAQSIKAESLQKIAERWNEALPQILSVTKEGIIIHGGDASTLHTAFEKLKAGLPGYTGRMKSVQTVLMDAHSRPRSEFQSISNAGMELGLEYKPIRIIELEGSRYEWEHGWLQRQWKQNNRLAKDLPSGSVQVLLPFDSNKAINSQARCIWDVDAKHPWINEYGNGGFPRHWDEFIYTPGQTPFRVPLFWVTVGSKS